MQFEVFIQDFTGVYKEQPFMTSLQNQESIHWLDCTGISGTDCYCDDDAQASIRRMVDSRKAIHFFDNGNYHYMSKIWTDMVQQKFDLVVFDHHPDMQPPRFEGILSCGGWIKEVLDHNQFVENVVIIGVADHLIEEIRNDPNADFEKYRNKVHFIPESMITELRPETVLKILHSENVYISIDKDAMSPDEAATNWDQGSLTFSCMEEILQNIFACKNILGVDICGERAKDMDFSESTEADIKNNELNQKLFNLLCKF